MTITYNEPLSDYSAYRKGNQFVVVIPKADAPRVRSGLRGRGFEGVQVEKRGEDTVLSFRIQPGVKARVAQQNNRLEVIFSSPGQAAASSGGNRSNATSNTQPHKLSSPTPGKATSQGAQTSGAMTQTPQANHNSASAQAAEPKGVEGGSDSSAEPTLTVTQANAASSPPTISTEGGVVPPQPDEINPEQTRSAPAPQTTFASLRMLLRRHWLPVLIAAVMFTSGYGIIAAQRRAGRSNPTTIESAKVTEDLEAKPEETLLLKDEAETTSPNHEAEPERKTEAEVSAPDAATAATVAEQVLQGDAALETPVLAATSGGAVVAASLVEGGKAGERRPNDIQEISGPGQEVEEPSIELIEIPEAEPDHDELHGVEVNQTLFSIEPITAGEATITAPARTNGHGGAAEARAAAVLKLAHFGGEDAFIKIGAAFDDPAQQVRDAAARSLFNFSADHVASFKRIMQESSTERRRRIGEAIASSGMAAEAISDLTSKSGEKAYDALLVLSLMAKAGEVRSLIQTIEEHPSTEVRLALVKLLALSGRQEVLSAFRYLATRDSLPLAVRSSIMEAIYQINNPTPYDLSTG